MRAPVAVTLGEPAGIGAELCAMLCRALARGGGAGLKFNNAPPALFVGDDELLRARAAQCGARLPPVEIVAESIVGEKISTSAAENIARRMKGERRKVLWCWRVRALARVVPGKPAPANAAYVLQTLRAAAALCQSGACAAMVTAPLQKSAILKTGARFVGQTEFLADCARRFSPNALKGKTPRAVMMLANEKMRVALATTHLPLRKVSAALTGAGLFDTMMILHAELRARFLRGRAPRIAVCGLNPHAGEDGFLGDEERRIILPAIKKARARGARGIEGPFAADTIFSRRADCFLAMYHDQGLPVLKTAAPFGGVNITLGLPFVRVSPDHGTALDLAGGRGKVEPRAMFLAFATAAQLGKARLAKSAAAK